MKEINENNIYECTEFGGAKEREIEGGSQFTSSNIISKLNISMVLLKDKTNDEKSKMNRRNRHNKMCTFAVCML